MKDYIECPYCKNIEPTQICSCCVDSKKITLNRYIQWNLIWMWVLDNQGKYLSIDEMNKQCINIIKDCYSKFNKTIIPIKEYKNTSTKPFDIIEFYCNQFPDDIPFDIGIDKK
jgi:hypothetical protein